VNKARDDALNHVIEACELFEKISGAVVILGVVLEVLLAWQNPPYGSWLEHWGPVVCDAMVAGGVVGEILFATRAGACQGELTRRTNERLADAVGRASRLELYTMPRSLPYFMAEKIRDVFSNHQDLRVRIQFQLSDAEAQKYADEIVRAFSWANIHSLSISSWTPSGSAFGTCAYWRTNGPLPSEIEEILKSDVFDEYFVAQKGNSPDQSDIFIWVGPKKIPFAEHPLSESAKAEIAER